MINIDANQGRIGELWWINSNTQPRSMFVPLTIGIIDTGDELNGIATELEA
jgi:hypothetical protein